MHWTEYSYRLAETLAWPLLALLVIVLFRTQLKDVPARVREVSFGTAKIRFGKGVEEAHKQSENLSVAGITEAIPDVGSDNKFLDLAKAHPEAAALEAYKRIERFLAEAAGKYPWLHTKNPLTVAQQLYDDGFVEAGVVTLVENVRELRNAAIHASAQTIAFNEAVSYRCLCDEVIHWLKEGLERKRSRILKADTHPGPTPARAVPA